MKNFFRVFKIALQYRFSLVGILICSTMVAAMWAANIGATYPLVEVVFRAKSFPVWIEDEIVSSQKKIGELTGSLAALEKERAAANPGDRPKIDSEIWDQTSLLDAEHKALTRSEWLRPLILQYMPTGDFNTLLLIVTGLLIGTLIKSVFLVGNLVLVQRVAQKATLEWRGSFYRQTLRLDLATFDQDHTSELLARFTNDASAVTGGISLLIGKLVREPLKIAFLLTCAALICWRLLIFSMIVLPLAAYIITRLSKLIKRASRRAMEEMEQLHTHLSETFGGIQTVKAFTMESYERNRFFQISKAYYRRAMKIATYSALSRPATEMIGIAMISLAILGGGYLVLNLETHLFGIRMSNRVLKFGELMTFFAFLIGLSDPARKLADIVGLLQRAAAGADRIYEMMDREPAITEPANPKEMPQPIQRIEVDNVSFQYRDNEPVLDGVSITMPAGQCWAIVGPNGCGKSTLMKLIPRFYDPQDGHIKIDGVCLSDMSVKDVRGAIGFVTQQTMLFDDTVANNIRYGSPNATDAQVVEAARKAHAHRFIEERLDDGYESSVGQSGNRLSGGQRQRIALARVILRDPKILLLDEATSQIDPESEQLIHKVLESFIRDRTTIMVTHRRSTLELADKILVMDRGRVIDHGTSDELSQRCELFRRLYSTDFKQSA